MIAPWEIDGVSPAFPSEMNWMFPILTGLAVICIALFPAPLGVTARELPGSRAASERTGTPRKITGVAAAGAGRRGQNRPDGESEQRVVENDCDSSARAVGPFFRKALEAYN
jgi:hypothetical protein